MSVLLHDLLDAAAATDPGAPAVAMADHRRDYAGLAAASREVAGWLAARGVRRGDRVVVAAPVHPLHAPLVYGCSRVGAVFVILHEQVAGHGLAHVLDDARPTLVIADNLASRALAADRGVASLSCVDAARECASAPPPPGGPGPLAVDPVCFIYTSGSTGLPKAVVSTHEQVAFAATAIQSQLGYRPGDVVYCPLPLSFDYGLYQLFLAALGGASVHLGRAADTGPVLLRSLRTSGATVLAAVPSLAASLAVLLDRFGGTVPLRLLTNTGAAMPTRTLDILRKHLPDLRVQLMFGLTECKRVAIMPPDEDLRRPGACGRPLPGTEVVVVDDAGRPVRAGTLGELVVRGPHVMAGYWRRPELTAQRFRRAEGLFPELHTGDYGWLDEDGYLYFSGRRDDIYKSRGFRVSATEVEAAALRVAGVRAAAVLPPSAERPDAILYAVTDLGADELLDRLREQIEPYKVPARCIPLESMPLNANGKTDKVALAAS